MRGMVKAWVLTGGAAATAEAESPRSLSCGSSVARLALGMMRAPARSLRPLRSKSSSATSILMSLFLKRKVIRLLSLVVEHTSDNNLMTFRFKNKDIKMLVAEEDFDLNGRKLRAGALIIPNADRAALEPQLKDLGLSAWAVAAAPPVKTHALTIPRIGYIHSWSRTQDEGWVRAALDYYSVPYTYFADQKLKEGNLRARYDVIVFPHVGGTSASMINGIAMTGTAPIPYKKTEQTPNLGGVDETDDIRGGMGFEGLQELARFVQQGGTLITEGGTSALMAEYNLAGGVTVEHPAELFARGSILRGVFSDLKSPIAYGYDGRDLPVYFNQDPVLNAAAAGGGGIEHGILVEVDRQILAVIAVGDGALEVGEHAAQDGAAREQLGGMLHGDAAGEVVLGHQG